MANAITLNGYGIPKEYLTELEKIKSSSQVKTILV